MSIFYSISYRRGSKNGSAVALLILLLVVIHLGSEIDYTEKFRNAEDKKCVKGWDVAVYSAIVVIGLLIFSFKPPPLATDLKFPPLLVAFLVGCLFVVLITGYKYAPDPLNPQYEDDEISGKDVIYNGVYSTFGYGKTSESTVWGTLTFLRDFVPMVLLFYV